MGRISWTISVGIMAFGLMGYQSCWPTEPQCLLDCPYGLKADSSGQQYCECRDSEVCIMVMPPPYQNPDTGACVEFPTVCDVPTGWQPCGLGCVVDEGDSEVAYPPGASFPAPDGCNTCYCEADGSISCTEMGCWDECSTLNYDSCGDNPSCRWLVPGCGEPELTDFEPGCYSANECNSSSDCGAGEICKTLVNNPCYSPCTECNTCQACGAYTSACVPQDSKNCEGEDGTIYPPGSEFPAADGCNTCFCGENGVAACTKIACLSPCSELDEKLCGEIDHCRWLVPGCGEGQGADFKDGCYPAVDCTSDASCGAGQSCQSVVYDPCHNSMCRACGAGADLCLPAATDECFIGCLYGHKTDSLGRTYCECRESEYCIMVMPEPHTNPSTGECVHFPTVCDIPTGWEPCSGAVTQ